VIRVLGWGLLVCGRTRFREPLGEGGSGVYSAHHAWGPDLIIRYRTMLDALIPAAEAARGGHWAAAAAAAVAGAEATKEMASLAGRSNYVPREQLRGTPDPGAAAMATLLAAGTQWAR
jgi:hypothetical protein